MMEARIIDAARQADINLPNQPFPLWGRMIVSRQNGQWSHTVEKLPAREIGEMTFPDEGYDFAEMSRDHTFIGAYDGETCVGLAVLQDYFFRYMYLLDLKVDGAYRGRGVGGLLIEKAREVARDKGYRGIYTQGQDNNASACLFYLRRGFRIGGLDTDVYKGTAQEGKADILFYLDI